LSIQKNNKAKPFGRMIYRQNDSQKIIPNQPEDEIILPYNRSATENSDDRNMEDGKMITVS
jgi:hypothetical protein